MSISRREWRNVWLFALAIIVITTIPYLLAASSGAAAWTFTGSLVNTLDGNSYLGKMRLGARGLWSFHLFYTTEIHDGEPLIFLPYIAVGQLVGAFTDGDALTPALIVAFHIWRALANLALILVTYRFIAVFLRSPGLRWLALLLATLGGGFGWLLIAVSASPPEFYIPEGFTWLVLLSLPHLALARAALLGGLLLTFAAAQRDNGWWGWALLAGACWWIVGLAVPFYLAVLYAILGAWGLAAWVCQRTFPMQLFLRALVAGGVTLPLFGYFVYVFNQNFIFSQWSAQNNLPSPNPLHYLLAYGVLAGLAFVGGRWAWRRAKRDIRFALLVGWTVIVPLLVYLPINVQRRTAEAVLVPLSILAVAGLRLLFQHDKSWRRARVALLATALPASLLLLLGVFTAAISPSYPIFRPTDEITALRWLDENAPDDAVVLSVALTGNVAPAWADVVSVVGHGPETLNWQEKEAEVNAFYAGELSPIAQATLLSSNRVDYIWVGQPEREQFDDGSPHWIDEFEVVYENDDVTLYTVNR